MLFDTPYYLAPDRKARHAYALLRDALAESGKVGIAKVVLRTREHLAAVEPHGDALILELMHFSDEIADASALEIPGRGEKPAPAELKAARMLIDTMAAEFRPEEFEDKYTDDVLKMIDARVHHKPAPRGKPKALLPANVVNLMDVLKKSLEETKKKKGRTGRREQLVSRGNRH